MKDDSPPGLPRKRRRSPAADMFDLAEAVRSFLTIEGVDGVGQPVTRISPGDLPPDLLGFVERLRGGAVETEDEMLLLTLPAGSPLAVSPDAVAHRLRAAFAVLCDYAAGHGLSADVVAAVFRQASGSAADPDN